MSIRRADLPDLRGNDYDANAEVLFTWLKQSPCGVMLALERKLREYRSGLNALDPYRRIFAAMRKVEAEYATRGQS